eukprot:1180266-Prorocentrum_minimum.AAC.1
MWVGRARTRFHERCVSCSASQIVCHLPDFCDLNSWGNRRVFSQKSSRVNPQANWDEICGTAKQTPRNTSRGFRVAEASEEPPKFIHLTYSPPEGTSASTTKLAVVGKGLTFDSGGYNLKVCSPQLPRVANTAKRTFNRVISPYVHRIYT